MNQQQALQIFLPILILIPVLYLRTRKMSKAQPLKWQYLWVRPAFFVAVTLLVLAGSPPGADDLPWLALAGVLGAGGGWQWGRTMAIEVHPENGTLMVKGSQAATLVLVVLILLRLGLKTGLQMEAPAWHLKAVLITDASLVFSAVLFAVRGLEMFLRAKKVMNGEAVPSR